MLPTIEGKIVRDVLLACMTGTSNKDYRIVISMTAADCCNVYTMYGPKGRLSNGNRVSESVTYAQAVRKLEAIKVTKLNPSKGYQCIRDETSKAVIASFISSRSPSGSRSQVTARPGFLSSLPAGVRAKFSQLL